jgi:hypothetical protein
MSGKRTPSNPDSKIETEQCNTVPSKQKAVSSNATCIVYSGDVRNQ